MNRVRLHVRSAGKVGAVVLGVAVGVLGISATAGASVGQLSKELVGPPPDFVPAAPAVAAGAAQSIEAGLGAVVSPSTVADAVWTGASGTLAVLLAQTPGVIASTVPGAVADAVCQSATKSKAVSTSATPSLPGTKAVCATTLTVIAFSKPNVDVIAVVAYTAAPKVPAATSAALLTQISAGQYDRIGVSTTPVGHVATAAPASHKRTAGAGGLLSLLVIVAIIAGGIYLVVRRRRSSATTTKEPAPVVTVPPLVQTTNRPPLGGLPQTAAPWDAPPETAARQPAMVLGGATAAQAPLSQARTAPSPVAPTVAPGWHPDPRDQLVQRYWDGAAWARTIRWDVTRNAWVDVDG